MFVPFLLQNNTGPSFFWEAVSGAGSLPLTFTRATTATVTDFEGLIKSCLSGELRIYGARRVYNRVGTSSENASGSGWARNGTTVTTPSVTWVGGSTRTVSLVDEGTATSAHNIQNSGTTVGTAAGAIVSCLVKMGSGAIPYMELDGGGAAVTVGFAIAADGTVTLNGDDRGTPTWKGVEDCGGGWYRVCYYSSTATANTPYLNFKNASGLGGFNYTGTNRTVYMGGMMVEQVSGQSNVNVSEYISVGVLSSPFHGYFVDGVKYFNYENGNTVSSNVVTEAQGAAITGTMGYLVEGQRTNLCLQSETFGTTWLPAAATISSNQITAPSGTTTADQLVADGTVGLPRVGQITAGTANTTNTLSVYAKAGTKNWLLLYQQSVTTGADSVRGWFNLNTGVVGSVSNQGTGSGATISITALNDGWYRCTLVGKPSTGASSVRMVVAMANADGGIDYATNVADNLYIWGAQEEDGVSFASTYIPTTTGAVTRNADVLTCPTSGIFSEVSGWAYCEVMTLGGSTYAHFVSTSANSANFQLGWNASATAILMNDAAAEPTKTGLTSMATAIRKRASTWSAATSTMSVTGDGATPASSAYDGGFGGSTTLAIGNNTAGTSPAFAVIAKVQLGLSARNSAQLQALTS